MYPLNGNRKVKRTFVMLTIEIAKKIEDCSSKLILGSELNAFY